MTNSFEAFIKHDLLGLPVLASEHGRDVDNLIVYVHWVMVVLFVGWLAYFIYALIRFRASKNPKADYAGVKNHASNYIEGGVVIAEAVLLLGFAVPLWAKVVDKFPSESESTLLQVTAQQFDWMAHYPGPDGAFGRREYRFMSVDNPFGVDPNDAAGKDDIASPSKDIRVPVNKPVIAYVTSKDVIHCFKVSPLRVTQDAIPGIRIPVHFKPTKLGQYQITCAQLCGNAHSTMSGRFTVETEAAFNQWLAGQAKKDTATTFE